MQLSKRGLLENHLCQDIITFNMVTHDMFYCYHQCIFMEFLVLNLIKFSKYGRERKMLSAAVRSISEIQPKNFTANHPYTGR